MKEERDREVDRERNIRIGNRKSVTFLGWVWFFFFGRVLGFELKAIWEAAYLIVQRIVFLNLNRERYAWYTKEGGQYIEKW